MATTTAGASHGGKRNNGATVLYGGDVGDNAPVTNAPDRSILGHHSGKHGAVVVQSANLGTHKGYSAGTFAYRMEAGKVVGMRMAESISGVANDILLSGAGDFGRRNVHWIEKHRRLHITSWDYVTGAATKGGNAGDAANFHNVRGSGHIDDAAHPTRAIPGELVYTDHGLAKSGSLAVATQADYDEKTG